jgi:toxin-antitoxin system PIN domain toxin
MKSLIFPDVNVWLALNFSRHLHNSAAVTWYSALDPSLAFVFCRHTQLGLFRLLSTKAVMADDVMSPPQCWQIFDRWIDSGEATVASEPAGMEAALRAKMQNASPSPKQWADAYLGAFAETAGLALVTFDRALAGQAKGAILLS